MHKKSNRICVFPSISIASQKHAHFPYECNLSPFIFLSIVCTCVISFQSFVVYFLLSFSRAQLPLPWKRNIVINIFLDLNIDACVWIQFSEVSHLYLLL